MTILVQADTYKRNFRILRVRLDVQRILAFRILRIRLGVQQIFLVKHDKYPHNFHSKNECYLEKKIEKNRKKVL